MAGAGCALLARLGRFGFLENKKGPKRPHAHRPYVGWPQPPPAVRLGTTRIKSLVILLRISSLRLPKGCAEHSGQTRKVKGRRPMALAEISGVRGVGRAFSAVIPGCASWRRPG